VPGDQVGGVLHLRDPLHLRLDEVADLGPHADQQTDRHRVVDRKPEGDVAAEDHHQHGGDEAGDGALDGLLGADPLEEGRASDPRPDEQRRDVSGDRRQDDEDDPGEALVAGEVEEEVAVHRQPDVERAGRAHRPAVEALPAAGDEEEGHQAADQRDREDELEGDAPEEGAAEGHVGAQRVEQPARRSQAHHARQPAELPEQEGGEDGCEEDHPDRTAEDLSLIHI